MSASIPANLLQTNSTQATTDITDTTPRQGRFISFEGTEGVGKTTAIEQLCARLQDS
ncbi:MAG: dTMP kinase, partial [Psychrobacter sp.]